MLSKCASALAAAVAMMAATAMTAMPLRAADAYAPRPDAVVDLMTREGAARVRGEWRYSDARVIEVEHRAPGPDLKPSGAPIRTHDIEPKAGGAGFDDSAWPVIDPATLEGRRSTGRLSFAWYRIGVTIPERIGDLDPTGGTAIFEAVVDDYAEIWVDGRLPLVLGQAGGALVAGFNAPNRVVLGRNLRPGQRLQIAIFAANGPLSNPPVNFIWLRSASIDFYRQDPTAPATDRLEIERADARLDAIVPPGARIERLAGGFEFVEGPVWMPDGYLLFSDPNRNVIHRWSPDGQVSIFRVKSGYSGADIGRYHQPGSNGLALDREGRLTICEHGNRRVTRLEKNGVLTVLADRYEGRRLSSPNDLVYRSDGALYFTDPPFGLPRAHDDPARELPYSGVFRLADGRLTLVNKDLSGPNGLAFSPDERFLYVSNWDPKRKIIMRFEVQPDGSLDSGTVFHDMGKAPEAEALDGLKVDCEGNVYASGPGGLWILSPAGDLLGKVRAPELPANFAWGDADRRALYLTARTGLYRLRLGIPGASATPLAAGPETRIERLDPRFDALVPNDARLEKVADGFSWVEGPVWRRASHDLLFSDIPSNSIFRWQEGEGASLFLKPAGYSGSAPFDGPEPGSNGLTLDSEGRLVLCQHGDRRIARRESDGGLTPLAERYEKKRLNSPNDVVHRSNGDLYFTDPPFGLPRAFSDPGKELDFQGIYRLSRDGVLRLLTREVRAPNGIGFSPDEKTLYVSNAERDNPVWLAFPVREDGTLGKGRVFQDARAWVERWEGVPDGLKVDRHGNVFAAGPGGIRVFSPDGTHLGSFITGVATSNCAWGEDGSTLFITAGTALHRVRLTTRGAAW